jgi:hypothetical protein
MGECSFESSASFTFALTLILREPELDQIMMPDPIYLKVIELR